MAPRKRQEVEGGFPEPWKPEQEGEMMEGFYMGFDWIDTGKRNFKSYRIKDEEGIFHGVAGGMLKTSIERIPIGSYVWITFQGMVDTQNGEAKDFKVEAEEGTKLLDPPTSGELAIPEGS